jgi:hypothetical protein
MGIGKQVVRVKVKERVLEEIARGSTVVVNMKLGAIVLEGRSGKRVNVELRSGALQRGELLLEVRKGKR